MSDISDRRSFCLLAAGVVTLRDFALSASCSVASGNPAIPTWLDYLAFDWLFTTKTENDKYLSQIRGSAGIAALAGQATEKRTGRTWATAFDGYRWPTPPT